MSVGSQELDRSILERKDRDELVAIAEAFGRKPASRAKKADIVDLILDLTGASNGAEDAAEPAEAPAASDALANGKKGDGEQRARSGQSERRAKEQDGASQPEEASAADEAAEADAQQDAQQASGETEQASGAEEPASPEDGDAHDRQERPAGDQKARQRQDQGQSPQNGQGQHQNQQGKQHQGGSNQGGSNQGSNKGGQQGGQQNAKDDGEPGNRRRRRRNRDRDQRSNQPEEVFQGEPVDVSGLLDLRDEGYGFLRLKGYLPSKDDVYVSVKQVRQFGLRKGDHLKGGSRPATRNEKNPALLRIDEVNGQDPEKARQRVRFEDLTPLFPDEKLRLEVEGDPGNMTARIVDLLSPIGKGQRGLIVSPPKAGKTTVMKTIARSIETNNPEAHLIVLLVDERPEEVTDFRRWLKHGEVAASTFDRPSDEHTHVSELVIERAKRLVEEGKDVVIILDGITRLARAYNLAAPASGRIMSGGIDAGALYPPKKFFGAARNVEEGGSLTIMATALVETNSRMDDAIFEEFKATGNMELKLDRKLADRRIYPAIDVDASGTRHEELLFERRQLQQVWKLRRVLSGLSSDGGSSAPGLELLVDRMKTFKSNDEFLAEIAKAPSIS